MENPGPICPQCHLPVSPEAYFCSNCGKALREKPLSVSIGTQIWIYLLSLILPSLAYLAISHWPGIKYVRSDNSAARRIGIIAILLLVISTIATFWIAIVWIQTSIQASMNSINLTGF